MNRNLRDRLRIETRPDHDKVDNAFASLDIATRKGFTVFLQSHEAGFSAINGASNHELTVITQALRADLDALKAPRIAARQPSPPPHPLACTYVVAGSRLGTAVLRKRWSATTDPAVQNAGHYFGLSWDSAIWRDLCGMLTNMDGTDGEAEQIIGSTKTLFAMFADLAHQCRQRAERQHAEVAAP